METSALQDSLAMSIHSYVKDQSIFDAFRAIPRHVFVPSFYDDLAGDKHTAWREVSSEMNRDEWLQLVYSDRPLTISLDAHNYPDSSSSQPSLMAQMQESAKLERGSRVLEIGTGTGYNAALLAHIAGPSNIVTIDINKTLVDAAQQRIRSVVGPDVTALHADGRNLPDIGSFNAIIVTGAHETIESSWIRALAPGGRLVTNWAGKLGAKVMIEATKIGDGLQGNVCSYGGYFMSLHDGEGVDYRILPREKGLDVIAESAFQQPFNDEDFRFFLQINTPSLRYSTYTLKTSGNKMYVLHDASHREVQIYPDKVKGDASLWKEISCLHERFDQLHRPHRQHFTFTAGFDGSMAFSYHGHSFHVRGLVDHY